MYFPPFSERVSGILGENCAFLFGVILSANVGNVKVTMFIRKYRKVFQNVQSEIRIPSAVEIRSSPQLRLSGGEMPRV